MQLIAKRHRPLVCIGETIITYHKGTLMQINLTSLEKKVICRLPIKKSYRFLSFFRVFERLLRTEVKTAAVLSENEILISYRGAAYHVNLADGTLTKELSYRFGMSGPAQMVQIRNVDGFEDSVSFGEYGLNTQRKNPSAVYVRPNTSGEWKIAFEFESGTVRHIHALIPDDKGKCVYILTGDFGKEAGIWKATDNFKTVVPLLTGSQMYRSVGMLRNGNAYVYATDTAMEQNYLTTFSTETLEVTKLCEMDGSCISNTQTASKLLFSTAVEADESIRGWRSWINMKRGAGIKSKYAKLLAVERETLQVKTLLSLKKDLLPYKLFQYGHMKMLDIPALRAVAVYPIAVNKYDGKLLLLGYDELE